MVNISNSSTPKLHLVIKDNRKLIPKQTSITKFILSKFNTHTSLFVVYRPCSKASIAVHFTGRRP